MRIKLLTLTVFIFIFQLLTSNNIEASVRIKNTDNSLPQITSITTSPQPIRNGWVCLPKGEGILDFNIKTKNANKITIWLVPMGTNTWKYRKLLVTKDLTKNDQISYGWKYPNKDILNHIQISVFSSTGEYANTIINVTNNCY